MGAFDAILWLLPVFVVGCAVIDMARRWADQIAVVLFGVMIATTMIVVLALSNSLSAARPATAVSVAELSLEESE